MKEKTRWICENCGQKLRKTDRLEPDGKTASDVFCPGCKYLMTPQSEPEDEAKTPWTPGPWKIRINGNTVQSHAIIDSGNKSVCAGISPKTGNARLIAAAPETAELMTILAGDTCDCSERSELAGLCACCRARALLKRIKGEE